MQASTFFLATSFMFLINYIFFLKKVSALLVKVTASHEEQMSPGRN